MLHMGIVLRDMLAFFSKFQAFRMRGVGQTGDNNRLYPNPFNSRFYHLTQLREAIRSICERHLSGKAGLTLLDFGCGTMPYRPLLEKYVAQYIGVDLPGNPDADFYAELSGKTNLPSECADLVVSTQVLEHVLKPSEYLRECYRLLKPDGLLILSTHGYWMYHPDPQDLWRWTSKGLKRIIEESGFQIVEFHGLMGLASAALQLFQDAVMPKIPKAVKPIFTLLMQRLIAVADRMTPPYKRSEDASVYMVVARKVKIPNVREAATTSEIVRVGQRTREGRILSSIQDNPTICVISPNKNAYSETFIRAHIERLPARIRFLYGGWFPAFTDDDRPLMSSLHRVGYRLAGRFLGVHKERFQNRILANFLKKEQVNVVLAEYGLTGVSVMHACHRAGIPLVVHFHGFDVYDHQTLRSYGKEYSHLFKIAAAIIAVSTDMERHLLQLGVPREKLHYNPYGVDTSLFSGANPAAVPPIFVAVGRFVDKKAPQLTLLAFRKVVDACPEARLIMVGDGPLLEACKQLARGLGISSAIEFLGPRPHTEVAYIMRRARAFVQHSIKTSYGDSEGTPVAVLEAGSTGLPVVSTRHGGITDVVIDGETGFLVDEGDIEAMAEYMLKLAEDPELAASMGNAARKRVCAEFSMEKSIGNLWHIIESVIETRGKS